MRILDHDRFAPATAYLLSAVSGVPTEPIRAARIVPSDAHWLRLPWHRRRGGGAMVLGTRIHVSAHLLAREADPQELLLLLAHEVGHLPHAAAFGTDRAGRLRFFAWATAHYVRSTMVHGTAGYRRSRIEREAERGRWVLRELLRRTGTDGATLPDDVAEMTAWLRDRQATIAALHAAYPAQPRGRSPGCG